MKLVHKIYGSCGSSNYTIDLDLSKFNIVTNWMGRGLITCCLDFVKVNDSENYIILKTTKIHIYVKEKNIDEDIILRDDLVFELILFDKPQKYSKYDKYYETAFVNPIMTYESEFSAILRKFTTYEYNYEDEHEEKSKSLDYLERIIENIDGVKFTLEE